MTQYLKSHPDRDGFFGEYGGAMLPPPLVPHFKDICVAYDRLSKSAEYLNELKYIRKHFQGRPTPISYLRNLSEKSGGAQIYAKREDLNHTGAHKLNHCMAEALLAKHMGKTKLIAETGAGQHGVALATAAAYFGMECEIHMGEVDIKKEYPNVVRMKLLGATVVAVSEGAKTLKEAVDSAFGSYVGQADKALFCIGSVVGPHPFPMMVRDFQKIVGMEARDQFLDMNGELPDMVAACVGGGSNAMGLFSGFIDDDGVSLHGVEPLGTSTKLGEHAATITYGVDGDIHAFHTLVLKDEEGNPAPVNTIASGLDYPGVGPEHAYLHKTGRVSYTTATDKEALDAFYKLSSMEGIIPALESAHVVA
ncbi:Tryptophan synthase (indole-salvaging), partial [hydrothermal vent metagenome]